MRVSILKANVPTPKGNVYIVKTLVDIASKINEDGRIMGELDPNPNHFGEVVYDNVSHTVRNARVDDDELTAEITILDTPSGKLLKQIPIGWCNFHLRMIIMRGDDGIINVEKVIAVDVLPN